MKRDSLASDEAPIGSLDTVPGPLTPTEPDDRWDPSTYLEGVRAEIPDYDLLQEQAVAATLDHTSGMRLLPKAQFACSREEWLATQRRFAAGKGYVRHHLPSESRMRLLDFDRDGEPYATFAKTIDLLGDGTVRLISTPGHTVGHMSVLLRVAGDRRVLVVGDAAYTLRNIREEILPLLTADDETSVQSLRELKAFADSEPEAILVPSHDPSAWHEASPRGGETMMAWAPAQRPIRRTASASVGA